MTLNPKTLFLIDGSGALLSAFSLGVILVHLESFFGMPPQVLYLLAFFPIIFAIYDFICYWRITKNWSSFLKIIAIANLLYCFVSIVLVTQHYEVLTTLGLTYFILELIIVSILAGIELKTAFQLKK